MWVSGDMWTYAVQPKTLKWSTKGWIPVSTYEGVFQLRYLIGVLLYTWNVCSTENSHQEFGRLLSNLIVSDFSIIVQMNLSAWPFCCGVCGALWRILIPLFLSIKSKASDLYSPPASFIHCCTHVVYCVSTAARNWWVALIAVLLALKQVIQLLDV